MESVTARRQTERGKISNRAACRRAWRIDSKKSSQTALGQFSGRPGRKNRRCASQSAKCIERACHRTLTRHWRNKRTGADDWPITRWPGYHRMILISRRMSVQPRPSKRVGTSCLIPRPRHFPTVSSVPRSLYYSISCTYPTSPSSMWVVCVCVWVRSRCPFQSLSRDEIGFMALFSSFADDVYQQIARRKRCFVLRHNGRPGLASRTRRNRKILNTNTR